jgi:phenylacetate-coenzyme A ligase PaaK-like adenylate-forming protein
VVTAAGHQTKIVKPSTGDPVARGDVGEIVVTPVDPHHPWIRLAVGDLIAALPGASPCGPPPFSSRPHSRHNSTRMTSQICYKAP